MPQRHPTAQPDDHPPLLPTWRGWYALVLLALAAEIALMVAVTRYFAA